MSKPSKRRLPHWRVPGLLGLDYTGLEIEIAFNDASILLITWAKGAAGPLIREITHAPGPTVAHRWLAGEAMNSEIALARLSVQVPP